MPSGASHQYLGVPAAESAPQNRAVEPEPGENLRHLRHVAEGIRHVAHAHRLAEAFGDAEPERQVSDERLAAYQEHVGHHVPGTDEKPGSCHAIAELAFALRPDFEVVLQHDALTIEMEDEGRIRGHAIEHAVDEIDQSRAILLERQIPLAIPVGVRNDVDVGRHPLVAPAVRPATTNRCSSRNAAMTGTRPMKLAAATSCHSVS